MKNDPINPTFEALVALGDQRDLECVNVNGMIVVRTVDTKEAIINQEDTLRDLKNHLGHPIEIQLYGGDGSVWNAAIGDMETYSIIYDLNYPDYPTSY